MIDPLDLPPETRSEAFAALDDMLRQIRTTIMLMIDRAGDEDLISDPDCAMVHAMRGRVDVRLCEGNLIFFDPAAGEGLMAIDLTTYLIQRDPLAATMTAMITLARRKASR